MNNENIDDHETKQKSIAKSTRSDLRSRSCRLAPARNADPFVCEPCCFNFYKEKQREKNSVATRSCSMNLPKRRLDSASKPYSSQNNSTIKNEKETKAFLGTIQN